MKKRTLFTPADVAAYILTQNMTNSRTNAVIQDLFYNRHNQIVEKYRSDYVKFKRSIYEFVNIYEMNAQEYSEVEFIMNEVNQTEIYQDECSDYFAAYFRLIKLKLLYSNVKYCKIKLRTLLRDFGYQRRTRGLMQNIKSILKELKLVTYLRAYQRCDISEIKLDDMVMIRLENSVVYNK